MIKLIGVWPEKGSEKISAENKSIEEPIWVEPDCITVVYKNHYNDLTCLRVSGEFFMVRDKVSDILKMIDISSHRNFSRTHMEFVEKRINGDS